MDRNDTESNCYFVFNPSTKEMDAKYCHQEEQMSAWINTMEICCAQFELLQGIHIRMGTFLKNFCPIWNHSVNILEDDNDHCNHNYENK